MNSRGFIFTGAMMAGAAVLVAALAGGYAYTKTDIYQANRATRAVNMLLEHGNIHKLPMGELSDGERAGLVYMREEEKLAHDVYLALYDKWGIQTFSNIAKSEQQHTDAVKALLDRYDIVDPVGSNGAGIFTDPTLGGLYTSLVAQGSESLVAGLTVGATIEDLDIKDLQDRLAVTDNEDITFVYENLMRGSRNHLRSFVKQLEKNGATYTAQYLTQDEVDAILLAGQEAGVGHHDGLGMARRNEHAGENGRGNRPEDRGMGQGKGQGQGGGQQGRR